MDDEARKQGREDILSIVRTARVETPLNEREHTWDRAVTFILEMAELRGFVPQHGTE